MTERPWTLDKVEGKTKTIRVKRCCENCGRPIGDVTDDETAAAIAGAPLPSVVDECGCRAVIEQVAMFTQRRDAMLHVSTVDGVAHPTWDECGPGAREEYLEDARQVVRALAHLGWAPLDRVLAQIGGAS